MIGAEVFSNENKPYAKIVDLDTDFQVSSIFGLRFGLKYKGELLFVGTWERSVIVNDMWKKVKCRNDCLSNCLSTQSTSKIIDIEWSDSILISEFKPESKTSVRELQVSITLDGYGYYDFTIGRVYGTIGIANNNEPLCVGGERKMIPYYHGSLFNDDHPWPCHGYEKGEKETWTYDAPFKFDLNRKVLVVDLSNALPTYFKCEGTQKTIEPLNLGDLHFGYVVGKSMLIKPIGNISYLKSDMWKRSGIVEVSITEEDDISNLQISQLVVFIEPNNTYVDTSPSNAYKMLFHHTKPIVLLRETELWDTTWLDYSTLLNYHILETNL